MNLNPYLHEGNFDPSESEQNCTIDKTYDADTPSESLARYDAVPSDLTSSASPKPDKHSLKGALELCTSYVPVINFSIDNIPKVLL